MIELIKKHWEQAFFDIVGLALLIFSFKRLWNGDDAAAPATFAMAFLALSTPIFHALNVSRGWALKPNFGKTNKKRLRN